ncbi:MAG TPA: hypothetical protein VE667_07500, partial [Xanthobacteraceae bacterium]|nr:hypothetical protein [Xanthobacteraceae bacterium]
MHIHEAPLVVIERHCNRNQYGIAVRFKKTQSVAKTAQSSNGRAFSQTTRPMATDLDRRTALRFAVSERSQLTGLSATCFTVAKHVESGLRIVRGVASGETASIEPTSTG